MLLAHYLNRRASWWRHAVTFFIAILAVTPLFNASAAQSTQSSAAFKNRAIDAAEQMRAYRQRALTKQGMRSQSAARQEVGIRIDGAAKTSSTIFFYDNIESGLNGWTTQAYTGSDIWHQSTLNAASPTHSWWPGVELQGNYNTGARVNNALISPSIPLTAATGPIRVMFAENMATERGWDYCMVDVSTDNGANWTPLRGVYGTAPSGDSYGWQITSLDLTAYSGQTVNLRFYLDTGDNNFNDFPGWFIDDIVVFDQGGTIMGKKFFDVNNNGIKDIGERGVKDWYITATGPITITTKTNERGHYVFTLPLGSYTVSEASRPLWTQTYPPTTVWPIDLATPDTVVDSVHFGNYTQASFIRGIKFNDLNRDGIYDAGDSTIYNWKIVLADTNGNQIDFDRTDSTGLYELYVFQPGRYVVQEVPRQGWVQTYPPAGSYTVDIPDLNTIVTMDDFGNYYSDSANTLIGQKFNDLNRNQIKDAHEPGIQNVRINLTGQKSRTTLTDSSGYFRFIGLPAGNYKVKEVPQAGWWQSRPDSFYAVTLSQGQLIDTLDFGNYEIVQGSISGIKFHDVNHNHVQDSSETGLSGWHILLSGVNYLNTSVNMSAFSDGSGNFSFAGLWPGTYTLSEVWKSGWTQTYPENLGVHHVTLGPEENKTGVDFGNIDSVLSIGTYRTFLPESLAFAVDHLGKHKPVPLKATRDGFNASFTNTLGDSVKLMRIWFSQPYAPGSLTASQGVITPVGDKNKVIDITFAPPMPPLDAVIVSGVVNKAKLVAVSKWKLTDDNNVVTLGGPVVVNNTLLYPMPDAVNLLEKIGTGLKVGLGGAHTVVHGSYKDILKSLFEKPDRTHIGAARCLDNFEGLKPKPIKKQQKYLTPSKHNNKLFAEAIALQTNIRGSDNGNLPAGFGNLIFDEGTGSLNPMNGMPIRTVAAVLDSFMSSQVDTGLAAHGCMMPATFGGMDPETLYAKIRKINGAFSGPLDTISFSTGLLFSGVHQLSDVPFLRFDPVMALRSFWTQPPSAVGAKPEAYALNQNYPNPFNPTTTISFTLSQPSLVTLRVYNILGQEVATLLNRESMEDGSQEVTFDATSLPSGVYFYHLSAQGTPDEDGAVPATFSAVRKMLLVK